MTDKEIITVDAQLVPEENKMKIKEAQALRVEVVELKNDIELTYYRLGEKLKRVFDCTLEDGVPLWKSWGFASFDDYCERELGFRERKAYYLLDVFSAVEKGPLSEADVERLGWTKAATLAPLVKKGIITQDNVGEWMEKTDGKSFNELRDMASNAKTKAAQIAHEVRNSASGTNVDAEIKKAVGKISVEDVSLPQKSPDMVHIFRVGLHEDQWKVWQNALQKAKDITGSDKDAWLVECIGTAFLAECLNGREDMLKTLLLRIEEAYGVSIMAVNDNGGIEFCNENLANLVSEQ